MSNCLSITGTMTRSSSTGMVEFFWGGFFNNKIFVCGGYNFKIPLNHRYYDALVAHWNDIVFLFCVCVRVFSIFFPLFLAAVTTTNFFSDFPLRDHDQKLPRPRLDALNHVLYHGLMLSERERERERERCNDVLYHGLMLSIMFSIMSSSMVSTNAFSSLLPSLLLFLLPSLLPSFLPSLLPSFPPSSTKTPRPYALFTVYYRLYYRLSYRLYYHLAPRHLAHMPCSLFSMVSSMMFSIKLSTNAYRMCSLSS